MELLKSTGAKLVSALLTLGVAVAGISWWRMEPADRDAVIDSVGRIGGWILGVIALPWLLFMLIGWVARRQSNAAGAILVACLTIFEAGALWLLFGHAGHGSAAWSLAIAAVLIAGVYNLFACDWIAEKVEG